MRKKAGWIAVIGVASILIGSVSVAAAGRGMMARGPEGFGFPMGRFSARLALTDDQKEKLEAIHDKGRDEMIPLQKEIARARNEMQGEWLKDSPSESALTKLAEKIGGVETRMEVLRIKHRLAAWNVLTPEQRNRAFTMGHRPGMHRSGRGDRDGRRCGMACMRGDGGHRGGRFGSCDGTGPGKGMGSGQWRQGGDDDDR